MPDNPHTPKENEQEEADSIWFVFVYPSYSCITRAMLYVHLQNLPFIPCCSMLFDHYGRHICFVAVIFLKINMAEFWSHYASMLTGYTYSVVIVMLSAIHIWSSSPSMRRTAYALALIALALILSLIYVLIHFNTACRHIAFAHTNPLQCLFLMMCIHWTEYSGRFK